MRLRPVAKADCAPKRRTCLEKDAGQAAPAHKSFIFDRAHSFLKRRAKTIEGIITHYIKWEAAIHVHGKVMGSDAKLVAQESDAGQGKVNEGGDAIAEHALWKGRQRAHPASDGVSNSP